MAGSYGAIRASSKEVGMIEPLMVHPHRASTGKYILVDGHLRYFALKELGETEAECVVSEGSLRTGGGARCWFPNRRWALCLVDCGPGGPSSQKGTLLFACLPIKARVLCRLDD